MRFKAISWSVLLAGAIGCGDDAGSTSADAGPDAEIACVTPFEAGSEGSSSPLAAGPGEARAGRLVAADFPADASPLLLWKPGDFVVANDRVALVIEDAGKSDLYDPWGGRPVGLGLV